MNEISSKIKDLSQAVNSGFNLMTKQLLQSESFMRHVDNRVVNLTKLENSYKINLKLRDGTQNMYEAYRKTPGNQQKNLANIKNSWKECNQVLFCYKSIYLMRMFIYFYILSLYRDYVLLRHKLRLFWAHLKFKLKVNILNKVLKYFQL